MKRAILFAAMCLTALQAIQAQTDVTKFLGIPVDGDKTEMRKKLEAKGFTWNSYLECLEGEFNGTDVYVYIVTNNNKVYRIAVADAYYRDATDIKFRFNKLCSQFENNKKYTSLGKDYTIPDNEYLSWWDNIRIRHKRYEAEFYQLPMKIEKKVWFMIDEGFDGYRILMFYDNEYNQANGEDL